MYLTPKSFDSVFYLFIYLFFFMVKMSEGDAHTLAYDTLGWSL